MELADRLGELARLAREAGDDDLARTLGELQREAADLRRRIAEKDHEAGETRLALRIEHELTPRISRSVLARRCPQWRELLHHIARVVSG